LGSVNVYAGLTGGYALYSHGGSEY
jgi:hypothetical protein